jgi:predicted dehydrogenase/threonine dehydrogenase-like Zn-dependent dehydrogenase
MSSMKQVLLDPRSGRVSVTETPAPIATPGRVLVAANVSLISPGTERSIIDLSSSSIVGKARARPDAVRQALETARREGIRSAVSKVRARLDHPYPLGYSLAGTVLENGSAGAAGLRPGDRVACAGAEIATHAELVSVPPLLTVPVPDEVSQEDAAFASIGAIALHAVRLSECGPGGTAVVLGLGLMGQLAAQLLSASGVRTLASDPSARRCEVARSVAGVDADTSTATLDAGVHGADAVIVAAGTTEPGILDDAVRLCRDRGRIVVLGAVPIGVDRDAMYRKELTLVVARSLGPGRYEPTYEEHGVDFPVGHVRWTEGRNMAAFLELVRQGKLSLEPLVTHSFSIDDAERAYALLDSAPADALAITLTYPHRQPSAVGSVTLDERRASVGGRPGVAVIGAGTFARGVLLPRLQKEPVDLVAVAAASGASALGTARRFAFRRATTDADEAISGSDVSAVVIATRHDLHADLAVKALHAGRGVYVEKPLALTREQLLSVCGAWSASDAILSVGFNRRFAPTIRRLRSLCSGSGPLTISYIVNVERPPAGSWILDPVQGGGVALSEGGHFLDTLSFLVGEQPRLIAATRQDECSYQATVDFPDGSVASLGYTTGVRGRGPKELITLAGRGVVAEFTDFRSARVWSDGKRSSWRSRTQDKGHSAALAAWVRGLSAGEAPVSFTQILASSEATLCLHDALQTGRPVPIDLGPYLEVLAARRGDGR